MARRHTALEMPSGVPAGAGLSGLHEIDSALAANYERLSPSQRRVINYMITDLRMAAVLTGPALAQTVGVSESTVTRAAQNLGFAGFPDLQRRLRVVFVRPTPEPLAATAMESGETSVAAAMRVMIEDAENIRRTVEEMATDDFDAAISKLLAARRVLLFGSRGSYGLALMLSMGFRLLLPDVQVLSQTAGDLVDQLLSLGPDDVVLAFSMRRVDRVAVDVVRQSRRAGATVIVVTDTRASVITRLADIPLVIRSSSPRLTTSFAAGASLVNALIIATSHRSRDTASRTLEHAEGLWASWGVWSAEDL